MARVNNRCDKTLDLFNDNALACGDRLARLVAAERRAYAGRPLEELRATKMALSLHPQLNTPREAARLSAVRTLLRDRRHGVKPIQDQEGPAIRRIPGTDLVAFRRRPGRPNPSPGRRTPPG